MKVTIEPHNLLWASEFNQVKTSLEAILSGIPIKSIKHVGSTSIPGLPAKPVLNIDIIVTLDTLPAVRAALSQAGCFDCGEMNVPGRFAFRQPGYGKGDAAFGSHPATSNSSTKEEDGRNGSLELGMRRNTYAMVEGCVALQNHLDVKKVLMEDEELREEYARVKMELADKEYESIGGVC